METIPVDLNDLGERKRKLVLGSAQAAILIGVGRRPLERLRRAGYLDPVTLADVEALATRSWVSGDVPILRLGEPAMDGDRRIGHMRRDSDEILLAASLGWWGGPIRKVVDTGWMALATGGFVVALLRIDGVADTADDDGYVRALFEGRLAGRIDSLINPEVRVLEASLADVAHEVLGSRVDNPKGSPIVVV